MANTEFFKCYGAEQRQDSLVRLSATNYLLIFGFGTDGEQGYNMRKYYDHKPTASELKADIEALINEQTEQAIVGGLVWNGKPVWLSQENQMNFKNAYDLAVQTEGATLPLKLKVGEDAEGKTVYHTFNSLTAFKDFISKTTQHVIACLQEGWREKDGVDYDNLLTTE